MRIHHGIEKSQYLYLHNIMLAYPRLEKAAEAALLKSAILLFCHPRYKLIIAANSDFSHIHQLQNVLKTKSLRV